MNLMRIWKKFDMMKKLEVVRLVQYLWGERDEICTAVLCALDDDDNGM